MELVDISRYESIADRLKRLSSNQSSSAAPSSQGTNHPNIPRAQMPPSYGGHQSKSKMEGVKHGLSQKGNYAHRYTEQSQSKVKQQPNTFIDQISTQREHRISQILGRHRPTIKNEGKVQNHHLQDYLKEKRDICPKEERPPRGSESKKTQLSKVKSQNALKMNEIMDNYNSYKQNKEKFLTQIQNTSDTSRERIVSKNLKEEMERRSFEQQIPSHKPSIYIQNSIDTLWNNRAQKKEVKEEVKQSDGNFQRMQRKTPKEIMSRVSELRKRQATQEDEQIEQPSSKIYEHHPSFSNIEIQSKEGLNRLKKALSPRGNRVPGKICKNQQRSLILEKQSHF